VTAAKINAGAVTADKITVTDLAAVSAYLGDVTLNAAGHMKGGQTAYNTGTGFFLGYESSQYKFSIGNAGDQSLTWDGTSLTINGNLFVGVYIADDTVLLSADVERNSNTTSNPLKQFTTDRTGTVRIKFQGKSDFRLGIDVIERPTYKIKVNNVQKASGTLSNNNWSAYSHDVAAVANDDITIHVLDGIDVFEDPIYGNVKEADFCAAISIPATGGTVDID
jgi:hypothetical protein